MDLLIDGGTIITVNKKREIIERGALAILLMTTRFSTQWNLRAAAAIITSLPPLVLFVMPQKYFPKGILGVTVIKG